jgi:hypothetical protein
MADMASRRDPKDPRAGRLLQRIRLAFISADTDTLSTSVLQDWAYGPDRLFGRKKNWHREMTRRAAAKVCVPIGRSSKGKGAPMLWKIDPERTALRSPHGKWVRAQQRKRNNDGNA